MGIQSSLAADAINTFLSDMGETIQYNGAPLQAVIFRNRASTGFPGSAQYAHEIYVANDPGFGRSVVAKGSDVVAFASRVGGTPENFTVLDVLDQDEGMWHLAVG